MLTLTGRSPPPMPIGAGAVPTRGGENVDWTELFGVPAEDFQQQ
jgi:hypothetical protein